METVIVYLHADRENMWNIGEKLKLKGDVLKMFSFAACEVKIKLEVNTETGEATIVEVDGKQI